MLPIESGNTIIIFLIIYQSTLFFIFLISMLNNDKDPKIYLAFYMLFYAIVYFFMLLYHSNQLYAFTLGYIIVIPLYGTFPPLFYLYIKSMFTTITFKRHYGHFLLSAIFLLANSIFYIWLPIESIQTSLTNPALTNSFTSILDFFNGIIFPLLLAIQPLIYLLLTFYLLWRYKRHSTKQLSYKEGINFNWLFVLLILFGSFYILTLILGQPLNQSSQSKVIYYSGILLTNAVIGIYAILQREPEQEEKMPSTSNPSFFLQQESTAGQHDCCPSLSQEEQDKILQALKTYMADHKPYLNTGITIVSLADKLNTNRQYLSQTINHKYHMNFYQYINSLRIEEFKQRYKKGEFNKYSITGMYPLVGFKSKSSFNTAFKKHTGMTPSEYIKQKEKV